MTSYFAIAVLPIVLSKPFSKCFPPSMVASTGARMRYFTGSSLSHAAAAVLAAAIASGPQK